MYMEVAMTFAQTAYVTWGLFDIRSITSLFLRDSAVPSEFPLAEFD